MAYRLFACTPFFLRRKIIMSLYTANHNITKLRTSNGRITELEINGQEVSLGAVAQKNKSVTIDVSTYISPVEITPTSPNEVMKKATVTLSNLGASTLYAWKNASSCIYTKQLFAEDTDNVVTISGSPLVKATTGDYKKEHNLDIWKIGDNFYNSDKTDGSEPPGTPGTEVTFENAKILIADNISGLVDGTWYAYNRTVAKYYYVASLSENGVVFGDRIDDESIALILFNTSQSLWNYVKYIPYNQGEGIDYNSDVYYFF
jgi:hypothetical protein